MTIPAGITCRYDIRGIADQAITPDFAYRLGRSYILWLQQNGATSFRIVIGRDARVSSASLQAELSRGLRDQGAEVIDVGLVSTPTFYFAVAYYGYDGGIMVSASHNPPEYNGFKIVKQKALSVSSDSGLLDILKLMDQKSYPETSVGISRQRLGVVKDEVKDQIAGLPLHQMKPYKVVADTANGMGALYLTELFNYLPCTLIKMFWDLDGRFPNHGADPLKAENMVALQKKILEEKADIGIATDGDGDRIFFVDNEGQIIDPSIIRGVLAKIFLEDNPGAKIAYDIRPGQITADMIAEYGGQPVITRVGHSLIKEQSLREGVVFAGESSGHYFTQRDYGFFEVPVIVTARLLLELSHSGQTLAEYMKPLRKYFHSGEINSKVQDPQAVLQKLQQKYVDGTANHLDGLSVEYPDWWFNVRQSANEPLIRLNLEARNEEVMRAKTDEVLTIIRSS